MDRKITPKFYKYYLQYNL